MPSDLTQKIGYAVGGAAVGALLVYGITSTEADYDEDRPPIIVRGGSIIFQSGDPQSSDPTESTGKPWTQYNGDWQPDHPNAKPGKWFNVAISGPGGCPALSMTKDVALTYRESGTDSEFRFTMKPRPGANVAAPALTGQGLVQSSGANPTLTFGNTGQGEITRIRSQAHGTGNVDCGGFTRVTIWQP